MNTFNKMFFLALFLTMLVFVFSIPSNKVIPKPPPNLTGALHVYASPSWPAEYEQAIEQAVQYWQDEQYAIEYKGYADSTWAAEVTCITWLKNWPLEQNWLGAYAEKQIYINANFTFSTKYNPPAEAYHLPSLLIHELGHALKLPHAPGVMAAALLIGQPTYYNVADPNLNQFLGYTEWLAELNNKLKETK